MSFAVISILLPLIAAVFLLGLGTPRQGATANLISTLLVFAGTLAAVTAPGVSLVHADPIGLLFGVLTGFISLAIAVTNLHFVRRNLDRMSRRSWRIYHAMGQLFLAAILLGLYADNILLLWLGLEIAVIAGAVALSLAGTPAATGAARGYLVTAGAALAFAAFGTMLLYAAARPATTASLDALSFITLANRQFDGSFPALACVFLLAGYGGIVAVFAFPAWHREIPAPLTGSLVTLTPNLALLTILRFSHLVHLQAAPYLLAAGLAGLVVTAVRLVVSKNSFDAFAAGGPALALFAFGIGSPAAIFGGLLGMILAPLISTAAFQTLLAEKPPPWLLGAALFSGSALPPSGLFSAVFIICGQAVLHRPLLSAPLILLLLLIGAALLRRIPATAPFDWPGRQALIPALQLVLMLAIAFAMPTALAHLLSTAAVGLQ